MGFKSDLQFGQHYQNITLQILHWERSGQPEGNFKPYDIWLEWDDLRTTIESKADRQTLTTGNIAIEFCCSGKPSGISTTEADHWVYYVVGSRDYYLIPTSVIRKAITERRFKRTCRGGDGYKAELYLFPRAVFQEYLDTVPEEVCLDIKNATEALIDEIVS
jgi:hypothetical protein